MKELIWVRQDGGMRGYVLYDDDNTIAGCEPDCGSWSWDLPEWTGIHGRNKTPEEAVNAIEEHILKINPEVKFNRYNLPFKKETKTVDINPELAELKEKITELENQIKRSHKFEVVPKYERPIMYETANDRYWSDYAAMSPEKQREVMKQRRQERERTEERRRGEWNGN